MAGGGNIIDTESKPGAYADALRFPPYIFDGDGTFFNEAYFLARVTPDFPHARVTLGGGKSSAHLLNDTGCDPAERFGLSAPVDLLSHDNANTLGGQHDHG